MNNRPKGKPSVCVRGGVRRNSRHHVLLKKSIYVYTMVTNTIKQILETLVELFRNKKAVIDQKDLTIVVGILVKGISLAIGLFLILILGIFSYKAFGTIFVLEEVPVIEDVQLSEKKAEFKPWFHEYLEKLKERQEELARREKLKKESDILFITSHVYFFVAVLCSGGLAYLYFFR